MSSSRQKIVIGIIFNRAFDSVVISKRPPDKSMEGFWEFPGGKSEVGETEYDTLSRELKEETGIEVLKAHRIYDIEYDYTETDINLSAWIVDEYKGDVVGREGQQVNWCEIEQLISSKFPPANKKLVKLLKLPSLYLITPDLVKYDDVFFKTLSGYLENGLKLMQFRSPSLKLNDRLAVAERLINLCEQYKCKLIFNGSYDDARRVGAHGVHLTSRILMQGSEYDSDEKFYVAGSCHNTLELEMAAKCNLDFSVLSPVKNTHSHSYSMPLGWNKVHSLVSSSRIPVYALGGLKPDDLDDALSSGCIGISMISGIWSIDDAEKSIKKLSKGINILRPNV